MSGIAPRKHRVLIIVENESVPHDRRVWVECQTLVAAGFGVSVVCPKDPGDPWYEVVDGVHLHKFPAPPVSRGKLGFAFEYTYSWFMAAALTLRALRYEGFDAIQACNPPDTYFALALPFKLLGKRFVFDHHDLAPEMYMSRFGRSDGFVLRCLFALERATFWAADYVISTNESFREVALTRGRKDPSAVTVVRNGPALERMRRRAPRHELKQGKRFLCCWLGVVGPLAGIDLALRAARHLVYEMGRRDCHFTFIGAGECLDDLQRLARDLGLEGWVTFTGWAEDDVWFDYLSTADIGLHPNPKDPKNDVSTMIKAMEYMAFELPIVAFDLRETRASAGDAAAYATPNDFVAYATLIAQLLDDPERRAEMGRVGRRRIEQGLSWDHQKARYVEVYERLLGQA
jgi:glycosyltransferase involved in cell wall biosynthesis